MEEIIFFDEDLSGEWATHHMSELIIGMDILIDMLEETLLDSRASRRT